MKTPNDSKFDFYYEQHLKHLSLKGLQPKTIDGYSRSIRRVGAYFKGNLDNLTEDQLLDYFHQLKESSSWSTVKIDLHGLKFFYLHVLKRNWAKIPIVKPPKVKRIPDIVTIEEAYQLFASTHKLSYRVFFLHSIVWGFVLAKVFVYKPEILMLFVNESTFVMLKGTKTAWFLCLQKHYKFYENFGLFTSIQHLFFQTVSED